MLLEYICKYRNTYRSIENSIIKVIIYRVEICIPKFTGKFVFIFIIIISPEKLWHPFLHTLHTSKPQLQYTLISKSFLSDLFTHRTCKTIGTKIVVFYFTTLGLSNTKLLHGCHNAVFFFLLTTMECFQ